MILPDAIEGATLGKTTSTRVFDDLQELRAITLKMVCQARRRLVLFTPDLEPLVFDRAAFVEEVKRLALSSPHSRIQILLYDSDKVVREGHRLIALAQRLSSNITVHKPNPDDPDQLENFMLVDHCGFIRRPPGNRYAGSACFHAPLEIRRLDGLFQEAWETSEPDPQLRRLYI